MRQSCGRDSLEVVESAKSSDLELADPVCSSTTTWKSWNMHMPRSGWSDVLIVYALESCERPLFANSCLIHDQTWLGWLVGIREYGRPCVSIIWFDTDLGLCCAWPSAVMPDSQNIGTPPHSLSHCSPWFDLMVNSSRPCAISEWAKLLLHWGLTPLYLVPSMTMILQLLNLLFKSLVSLRYLSLLSHNHRLSNHHLKLRRLGSLSCP